MGRVAAVHRGSAATLLTKGDVMPGQSSQSRSNVPEWEKRAWGEDGHPGRQSHEAAGVSSEQSDERWLLEATSTGNAATGPIIPRGHSVHVISLAQYETKMAEAREVIAALSDAMGAAMETVQAHVRGEGPRGMDLLPLIAQADEAADARDALLGDVLLSRREP